MKTEEMSFLLRLIIAEAYEAGWEERNRRDEQQSVNGPAPSAQLYAQDRLREFQ